MSEVKLKKISSETGIPGVSKIEPGWGSERWSDGTHEFLLQYSPESCSLYSPKGFTNQVVVDAAVTKAIDYELVPIIDGEVVTVHRDHGERLMHAVYDTIVNNE